MKIITLEEHFQLAEIKKALEHADQSLPTKRKLRMATLKRCSNFPQNKLNRLRITPIGQWVFLKTIAYSAIHLT